MSMTADVTPQAERDLARVVEFRNRLVAYMNIVLGNADGFRWGDVDQSAVARLQAEQPWLAQEYGRLYNVINQWGLMQMASPALGITSRDVLQDAIHDVRDVYYRDLARLSIQHLDLLIGRLSGQVEEAERERNLARERREAEATRKADERAAKLADPDQWYRVTSPIYWLGRLAALVRWVFGTWRGRIAGAVSVIVVAIISGIVSGVAQGWFTSLSK
jgi:hypothetical protein